MKKKIVIDASEDAEVKKVERNVYKDNAKRIINNKH